MRVTHGGHRVEPVELQIEVDSGDVEPVELQIEVDSGDMYSTS